MTDKIFLIATFMGASMERGWVDEYENSEMENEKAMETMDPKGAEKDHVDDKDGVIGNVVVPVSNTSSQVSVG
jgi:hypothetical protein